MSTEPRCYTQAEVINRLKMAPSTFRELRRAKRLPFLEELVPRLGKTPRYRADLVDRYLAGQWGAPRLLRRHG